MATITAMRVLAHQGGWDEILFVLAPLVIFAGLLAVARRRVEDLQDGDAGPDPAAEDAAPTDPA